MTGRTADNFVESVMLDSWPRNAACVDFGLNSQKEYEAYYEPIRTGEITADQLHSLAGNGPGLTELLAKCKGNIHPGIKIETLYDLLKE